MRSKPSCCAPGATPQLPRPSGRRSAGRWRAPSPASRPRFATPASVSAMCFDLDSEPPIAPIAGAAVSHDELVLETADGSHFAAFHAGPDQSAGTGVVILPDVRGLYRFYRELAFRFAERGH